MQIDLSPPGEVNKKPGRYLDNFCLPRSRRYSFRFQFGHAQQMAEHLEPVAACQPDQIAGGFRDEGSGLVRAALPVRFVLAGTITLLAMAATALAGRYPLPVTLLFCSTDLARIISIEVYWRHATLFESALQAGILQPAGY
jgi:hypothetical protein